MEVGDGQTEARGGLKTAGRRVHADRWRLERVVGWEHQCAPILPVVVGRVGRAGQNVMPPVKGGIQCQSRLGGQSRPKQNKDDLLKNVRLARVGRDERRWLFLEGLVFARQTLVRSLGGHDCLDDSRVTDV